MPLQKIWAISQRHHYLNPNSPKAAHKLKHIYSFFSAKAGATQWKLVTNIYKNDTQ